jgi:hypothetical protein
MAEHLVDENRDYVEKRGGMRAGRDMKHRRRRNATVRPKVERALGAHVRQCAADHLTPRSAVHAGCPRDKVR